MPSPKGLDCRRSRRHLAFDIIDKTLKAFSDAVGNAAMPDWAKALLVEVLHAPVAFADSGVTVAAAASRIASIMRFWCFDMINRIYRIAKGFA